MNQERKLKLERRLEKQKRKSKEEYSVLFKECIASLSEGTIIYSQEQSNRIYNDLPEKYEFTTYGRVNMEVHVFEELTINDLLNHITKKEKCIVLWSHGNDPVIQVDLAEAINNLDEILAVSPDVWLYRVDEYVIEFLHDGVIRKFYRSKDS
ncbi:hypothetical protein ACFSVM_03705 [Paenibacillus shunpengii]|uniref:Uncharacterized protein n=1 Tax=Paenibacillus shunpengii TaxID=2054424 RepID=A0ABW5SLL9_9BACL